MDGTYISNTINLFLLMKHRYHRDIFDALKSFETDGYYWRIAFPFDNHT